MSLFDIDLIKNRIIYSEFHCGDVTFFNRTFDSVNKISFDLFAYTGKLISKPDEPAIGMIFTELRDNHHIYITDCYSCVENRGNGKKMFGVLLQYILLINNMYPITEMCGFLSKYDFKNWKKLLYFYGSLDEYMSQINLPVKLNFQLQNYTVSELIENMEQYKGRDIYFRIFISYN